MHLGDTFVPALEEPRLKDKPHRRYASSIERALALFDAARLEWPDYISFLGKLLKVRSLPLYLRSCHVDII